MREKKKLQEKKSRTNVTMDTNSKKFNTNLANKIQRNNKGYYIMTKWDLSLEKSWFNGWNVINLIHHINGQKCNNNIIISINGEEL